MCQEQEKEDGKEGKEQKGGEGKGALSVFADCFYVEALLQHLARQFTMAPQPSLPACAESRVQPEVKDWGILMSFVFMCPSLGTCMAF